MKRAMKLLAAVALAGILAVAGVLAAQTHTMTTSGTISFTSTHAAVKVDGSVLGATGGDSYLKETYTGDPGDEKGNTDVALGPWTLTGLVLSSFDDEVIFQFELTNIGSRGVFVEFKNNGTGRVCALKDFESDNEDYAGVEDTIFGKREATDGYANVGYLEAKGEEGATATLRITMPPLTTDVVDMVAAEFGFTIGFVAVAASDKMDTIAGTGFSEV